MEKLVIAGREFDSRLFLGTGKFNSNEVMEQAILTSGTEMVTVAMKRIDMDDKEDDMLKHIIHPNIQLLPRSEDAAAAHRGGDWRYSLRNYRLPERKRSLCGY